MALRIKTQISGDVFIVRCDGRIVFGDEGAALRERIGNMLSGSPRIVVNLNGVHYVDSGGLGILVGLSVSARNRGGELKLTRTDPDVPGPHLRLCDIYYRTGKESEAVAELQKGLALQAAEELAAALPRLYASSGFQAAKDFATREQIRILTEASKQDYISPIALATDYAVLGEKDKAFEWLEKAYEEHAPGLLDLDLDPDYDSLRTDSRFQNLVRRIKLPQ